MDVRGRGFILGCIHSVPNSSLIIISTFYIQLQSLYAAVSKMHPGYFVPTNAEYRNLLQRSTKSPTKREVYLLDHEDIDTQKEPIYTEIQEGHLDIIGFLPFEIVTIITGYLNPVDLIISRRVIRNDHLIPINDDQSNS